MCIIVLGGLTPLCIANPYRVHRLRWATRAWTAEVPAAAAGPWGSRPRRPRSSKRGWGGRGTLRRRRCGTWTSWTGSGRDTLSCCGVGEGRWRPWRAGGRWGWWWRLPWWGSCDGANLGCPRTRWKRATAGSEGGQRTTKLKMQQSLDLNIHACLT